MSRIIIRRAQATKLLLLGSAVVLCLSILLNAKGAQKSERAAANPPKQAIALDILYTRDLYGHAELCGCSPAQQGGLPRLSTFFHSYKKKNPNTVVLKVDCGGFLPGLDDPAQLIHIAQMVQGYANLKFDAINLGAMEAGYRRDVLQKLRDAGLPVTSASLLDESGTPFFPPYVVKKHDGITMAFVGVIGGKVATKEFKTLDPAEAVARALPAVSRERPDLIILLGDLETNEAIELAKRFKELNLILSAKGLNFSPTTSAYIAPWSGEYGKQVGLALLKSKNGSLSFRSSFFPLSADVASDEVLQKALNLARTRAEAKVRIRPHPSKEMAKWVGSTSCQACHRREHQIWKGSKHSTAIDILREQNAATRLDCVSCHVTGYKVDTAAFFEENVGCEACHGPGKDHIAYFNGKAKERPSMKATSSVCAKCHTEPNSPLFSFDYYWEKIKH